MYVLKSLLRLCRSKARVDCLDSCVVICGDWSCASRTCGPAALWAGWISVKQTVCTSQRACEIIYFYAVPLSNCHWLLFPAKQRLFSARLFLLHRGFLIFQGWFCCWVFNGGRLPGVRWGGSLFRCGICRGEVHGGKFGSRSVTCFDSR